LFLPNGLLTVCLIPHASTLNLHAAARRITITPAVLIEQAEAASLLLFGFRLGSLGLGGGGSLASSGGGSSGGSSGGGRASTRADAGEETLDVDTGGGLGEEAGPESLDISDTSGLDDLLDGFSSDGDTLSIGVRTEGGG